MIDKTTQLWKYLSEGQRGLIEESHFLVEDIKMHPDARLTDYSYLVFPIAKAYEGFLKQLFLDRGYINREQYESTHLRLGKVLSPYLQSQLGNRSVYFQIRKNCGIKMADNIWDMWKRGRNVLFHYFPHNLKAISLQEAEDLIYDLSKVMEKVLYECKAS